MSAIRWIKLSTDLFNDEKIRYIEQLPEADGILTIWVKLLVLAGQKNMGGEVYFNDEIPYTDEMLSAIFHRKVNTVRLALETFQRLRMIEISADKTIIICNWARHQNIEGLDKIRVQNLERKQRQRQRHIEQRLLSRDSNRHVTVRDTVTPECVTAPPQKENKSKIERIESPTVPQRGTEACNDEFTTSEAKRWLNELFGRKRAWSDEEDDLLAKLLPISRDDQELIQWGYSLRRDSEGWALVNGERRSKPKQSLLVLLREFGAEIDKWRTVRRQGGPKGDCPPRARISAEQIAGAKEAFGSDVPLPEFWDQLSSSSQREITDFLAAKEEKVA